MEHPEKLDRINPALVDKMIRTEDAVSRGRAELARQELRESAERTAAAEGADRPSRRLLDPEAAVVGFVLVLGLFLLVLLFANHPPA